jgi:DNA-binding NtrC family response regulator/tetratricopeptide (TPR) repeat protein
MTARTDTITDLFDAGEYGRIFEHTQHLQTNRTPDPVRAALIAQATFETGDVPRARAWAALCLESTITAARARGQLVLALCHRASGDMTRALQLHQSALRSAEESQDDELDAWTAIHLLRYLFVSGRNVAPAMVPNTRVKASKAGSVHATAYLHATVAVGEGQAGRPEEARRHLQIAARLVDSKPHPWLLCSILSARAALALAERELTEAAKCLEQLRTIARKHGLNADYARANVNIGNLAMLTGRYEAAETALQEAMSSPHTSVIAKLTAAETLAEVRLAQDRLTDCEDILRDIERIAKEASLMDVSGVRWGKLVRAQVLIRKGQPHVAAEHLAQLDSCLRPGVDRPLAAATRVTAAQALVMCGNAADGAKQLAASVLLDPTALRHVQGQFYDTAASVVSPWNRQLAGALRDRARLLSASQGAALLGHESQIEDDRATDGITNVDPREASQIAVIVESIASLLGLGTNPQLLTHELRQTIQRLGFSPHVAVLDSSERGPEVTGEIEISLPQTDSTNLLLRCDVPKSPEQAVILGSVVRVGQVAIELERLREAERRRAALWPDASVEASAGAIFESDAMRDVLTVARRIADTSVPVLITGETGTGKEVLARLIHAYSARSKAAFSPLNCTSVARDVIESQLFGHRKGSFTGATDHSQGVIRAANRGTLFLDEIGDMHIEVQPKLLRFLESGEIHPLGEPKPTQVDVRVIAATNVDLKAQVSVGRFREDLYYRLSIVPLHLPPLRERRSEIHSLATHYLAKYALEFAKGDLRLSEDAVEYLLLFRWPGNVRQLANEMRRIAALAEVGALVMPEHLSAEISRLSAGRKADVVRRELQSDELIVRLDQPLVAAVEHVERAMIVKALGHTNGTVERAAAMLGLSRKGLYLKRQKYQIDTDSVRAETVSED